MTENELLFKIQRLQNDVEALKSQSVFILNALKDLKECVERTKFLETKRKNWETKPNLKNIYETFENYLLSKPCKEIICTDCGKTTIYESLYHLYDDIATCGQCNANRRIANY